MAARPCNLAAYSPIASQAPHTPALLVRRGGFASATSRPSILKTLANSGQGLQQRRSIWLWQTSDFEAVRQQMQRLHGEAHLLHGLSYESRLAALIVNLGHFEGKCMAQDDNIPSSAAFHMVACTTENGTVFVGPVSWRPAPFCIMKSTRNPSLSVLNIFLNAATC